MPTFPIPRELYDAFGGGLESRVSAFAGALEAHKMTEGVPAPLEDPIVEHLARSGDTIQIVEPPTPVPPTPETPSEVTPDPLAKRRLAPLALRMRLGAKRVQLTTQAALDLRADPPDPTLQVIMDDLNSSRFIDLDSLQFVQGLETIVARGWLTPAEADALRADCQPGEEPF